MNNSLLTALFSLVCILNTTACADTDAVSTNARNVNIGGISFSLADNAKQCQLRFGDRTVNLEIPWPCDFHRGPDNEIRIKAFNNESVFLIEYSRPHPELPNDCETRLQAVKVANNVLRASEHTELVAACPPFQWDEKMFMGLFED